MPMPVDQLQENSAFHQIPVPSSSLFLAMHAHSGLRTPWQFGSGALALSLPWVMCSFENLPEAPSSPSIRALKGFPAPTNPRKECSPPLSPGHG